MSAQEGKGAIFASLAANLGIATSKFVAFALTGASSMLAEAVHSLADSSNQILLLIGSSQSRQKPNPTHPFGYGRAHFLFAFMVAIVLFSIGGLFAIYEGIHKIQHPEMLQSPLVAYVVLAVAFLFEALALRTVLHEARSFKPKGQSWPEFLSQTKSVNHIILALEDSAALVGLVFALGGITLTFLTGNPVWDGVGTLMIGGLLVAVAIILFREVKSLLIGEAVDPDTQAKMQQLIKSVDGVGRLVDLKTLYVGPLELFVAMKITVNPTASAKSVAGTINQVEAALRRAFPIIRLVYIEPDIYKPPAEHQS